MGCYLEIYSNYKEDDGIYFLEEKAQNFFRAYLSIKDLLKWVNQTKIGSIEAYIVSKKSVENYINILIKSGVMKKICEKNYSLEEEEKNLKKEFEKYNIEKSIKILKYEDIIKKNKNNNDNEFIIVDGSFFESMNITVNDNSIKKVEIIIDNINSFFWIEIDKKIIFFNKSNYGFYRFCSKEETETIQKCIKYNNLRLCSTVRRYYNGFGSKTVTIRDSSEYDFLSVKINNIFDTKNTL